MVLLIDANVLLDVLLNREEFVQSSSMVWKLCETGQACGYVSVLTFANIVYVMRNKLDPEKIENVLKRLLLIFNFIELSLSDIKEASVMRWNDFEDCLQFVAAQRLNADYIVTRNVKDFKLSSVPALTPDELLATVSENGLF